MVWICIGSCRTELTGYRRREGSVPSRIDRVEKEKKERKRKREGIKVEKEEERIFGGCWRLSKLLLRDRKSVV